MLPCALGRQLGGALPTFAALTQILGAANSYMRPMGPSPAAASPSGRGLHAGGGAMATSSAALVRKQAAVDQLQAFNATLPELQGQAILARVLKSSRWTLLVDPGYHGLCLVDRRQLGSIETFSHDGRPLLKVGSRGA
jgi:hypothetical protein